MIRQVNLNNHYDELQELLKIYIRQDTENPDDGMFYNVKTCTKTISGTEYYGARATAQIGSVEVNVVDFYLLNDGTLYIDVYYNGTSPSSQTHTFKQVNSVSTMSPSNKLSYAYCTDNGLLINFQLTQEDPTHPPKWLTVMITKGSDGYPFVILPSSGMTADASANFEKAAHSYNIRAYHVTDVSYETLQLMMLDNPDQTAMCPLMSYGNQFEVVYAPYAYWNVQASTAVRNAGFSVMKFNGELDGITDGFWTILDTVREESA